MSVILTSFLVGIGVGGWVYFQVWQRTGGVQVRNGIVLAAVVGFFAFLIMYTIMEKLTGN